MTGSIRLAVDVPTHIATTLDKIATERGLTRTGLVRQALGIIKLMHEASQDGHHVGVVRDRKLLDTLLVAPL